MINKIKDFVAEHITLTAFVIIVALVLGCASIVYKADTIRYNNGICAECGGVFEYKGYIKERYCYKCNSCEVIVTTTVRQEEDKNF